MTGFRALVKLALRCKVIFPVSTYQIIFLSEGRGEAKTIEFEAIDASEALQIIQKETAHCIVRLRESGRDLCTIQKNTYDFWIIY